MFDISDLGLHMCTQCTRKKGSSERPCVFDGQKETNTVVQAKLVVDKNISCFKQTIVSDHPCLQSIHKNLKTWGNFQFHAV